MLAKLKKALIVIIPVLLIIAAINIREAIIKNPIRSMYLAGKRHDFSELYAIKELDIFFNDSVGARGTTVETIRGKYKDEYLRDGFQVNVVFRKKTFDFYSRYKVSNQIELLYSFFYEPKNNTLHYETIKVVYQEGGGFGEVITYESEVWDYLAQIGISDRDIKDIQRYIVYDVVITSWRSRHGNPPELIHDYILNIEDHTFNFTE